MKKFLYFLWCIIWTEHASAQLQLNDFTRYTIEDGLSHQQINSVVQDQRGFIWMGTEYGLLRYDGTSFVNLSAINPGFSSIDQFINKLTLLPGNELGISSSYGAYILSLEDYSLHPLEINADENLKNWALSVVDIGKDTYGNYGVSTKTGFYVFDASHKPAEAFHFYGKEDIGKAWMLFGRNVVVIPDGRLLQKNMNGYAIYDPDDKRVKVNPILPALDTAIIVREPEINFTILDSSFIVYFSKNRDAFYFGDFKTNQTFEIIPDKNIVDNITWYSKFYVRDDTTLILTGRKGMYFVQIDKTARSLKLASDLLLPDLTIYSVLVDKEKRIWLGTSKGLFKQEAPHLIQSHSIIAPGLGDGLSIKWLEFVGDTIYMSTARHGLLMVNANDFSLIKQIRIIKNHEAVTLFEIFPFQNHVLWIATSSGIMQFNTHTHAYQPVVFPECQDCATALGIQDIFRDQGGDIWIAGGESNKVYRYELSTGLMSRIEYSLLNEKFRVNIVFRFSEDAYGNIWFCGDAMARFNVKTNLVDSLIEKLPLQDNAKKPYAMHLNSRGDIWYATNSDNWHIHPKDGKMEALRVERLSPTIKIYQNMINDVLYYISEQGKLVMLNTLNRDFRIFSYQEGWQKEQISSIGFFENRNRNTILYADGSLIYEFPSDPLAAPSGKKPFISEIHVFGKRRIYQPSGQLVFAHDENTMQINFLSVNYTDPSNQVYSYTLSSRIKPEWITVDKPEIMIAQLPPGQYALQIKVSSKNNLWPPIVNAYVLKVKYPFYLSWAFVIPAIVVLGLMAWGMIRHRMKEIRKISDLDRLAAEYELKALHAQMNPHFVFNCLNSIKEMIMSKDNKNANVYLNKFSYLLRSTLDQSRLPSVTLKQTIEYIRQYLEMEKLRFDHFDFALEIDPGLQPNRIIMAPMLFQPIVENAIWHGLSGQKGPKKILVRFYPENGDIICEVEDYGIGISKASKNQNARSHQSTGISNIVQRIELLNRKHETHYQLAFIDKSGQHDQHGTIVRLSFKSDMHEID